MQKVGGNTFKVLFVIIGTIVGAGFASGKEIYSFFFIYGIYGIFGIFLSCFIISYIIYKVLKLCLNNKIEDYASFCKYLGNEHISKIVNIFLIITYYIMISGFSSFLNQEFKIQPILGSIIIIILCYRIFMKNINGIIKVSNYLIPVLIFFLIIISCKNLDFINNYNSIFKNNYNSVFIYNNFYIIALIKSILYASYNTILLIPVLVNLSNIVKNKNCVLNISLSSFFALILLCFCVYNLLLLGNNYIFNLEMPIIEIVEKYSDICKFFYIFMIGISIFTTAISTGFSFLNNISNNKKTYRRNLIFISVSAIILSQISFSILVNLIYPVLGFVGIFEIILLLKNK